jgi:hypothetical protein
MFLTIGRQAISGCPSHGLIWIRILSTCFLGGCAPDVVSSVTLRWGITDDRNFRSIIGEGKDLAMLGYVPIVHIEMGFLTIAAFGAGDYMIGTILLRLDINHDCCSVKAASRAITKSLK